MSRIGTAIDKPIPTNEKTLATEQTSETESIQKTDITAKAPLEAEAEAKEKSPAADTKGQQFESHLGGLARQTELQGQLPSASAPVLKDLPDANRNLDPNIHLDEKIDVTKNLPDGHAINSGLAGLGWGIGKGKTGPNHMGVDITTGGMKAPTDVLAEVLNPGKPNQANTSGPKQGPDGKSVEGGGVKGSNFSNGRGTPPPGAELNFRAPNSNLVGQSVTGAELQTIIGPGPKPAAPNNDADKQTARNEANLKDKEISEKTKKEKEAWDKKYAPDAGTKMTDPDAGGGDGTVRGGTSAETERAVNAKLGQVEHGINPDLGVNGGPNGSTPEVRKNPMDMVKDPIDDGETNTGVTVSTDGKATLATDIHGPRYVNSDSGVQPPPSGGDDNGGRPNTGNFS